MIAMAALILSLGMSQTASAQDFLKNLLSTATNKAVEATSNSTGNSATGNLIGNLLASVTGGLTTTQANLIGTWNYAAPCVQFESENYLTQAGGTAVAAKVEAKLETLYKMVGISAGKVSFTFEEDGTMTYTLGSRKFTGTYVFDAENKTVTITTQTKRTVKAFVTISGNQMSLCFDSTKVLQLFTTISAKLSTNISQLAGSYSGMKSGFKFTK